MAELTEQGRAAVSQAAGRHGISEAAAMALLEAVQRGHGTAAQFSHPDLGGMGQWSKGGMTQIGEMSNDGLKSRVTALADTLAGLLDDRSLFDEAQTPQAHNPDGERWWPDGLGSPDATGGQNDAAYAFFAGSRRLAIRQDGRVRVYDSGDHRIGGVSQSQSGETRRLRFSSQHGSVAVSDLREVN